eukprot:8306251-Heterocapsa_arctica.AAC.1
MRGRKCHIPLSPDIDLNKLAGIILAAGDSAAGCDGWPYEVYHCGVRFVSDLLAQAFIVAETSDKLLIK